MLMKIFPDSNILKSTWTILSRYVGDEQTANLLKEIIFRKCTDIKAQSFANTRVHKFKTDGLR